MTKNKITEGNAFALNIRQAVWRTIGGVITPLQTSELLDIHLYVGQGGSKASATEYMVKADGDTISAVMPATLKRGVYRTWLTAIYNGREVASNCDAAFEIVAFDEHYQAYAPERVDAPMAVYLQPADVTDAELEQLKAEFRAKNAALDAAKAEAEQARQVYIAKAEAIESIATSEQVVAIGALTSEEIGRVKELIGTPADGQADTLFAAINASPVGIIADVEQGKKAISDAIVYRGGESSQSDSFKQIAESIANIPAIMMGQVEWVTGFTPADIADALYSRFYKIKSYINNNVENIDDASYMFYNCKTLEIVSMQNLIIANSLKNAFANCNSLVRLDLPKIKQINESVQMLQYSGIVELNMPSLEYANNSSDTISRCSNLKVLNLPKLKKMMSTFVIACGNLERVICPSCTIYESNFNLCSNLKYLELGTLLSCDFKNRIEDCYRLSHIVLGHGTNINLYMRNWGLNSRFAENVNTDEFNANFRSGIIERIYDRSGLNAPNTITLGKYAFEKLTEETIAMATAKGWNIAQA